MKKKLRLKPVLSAPRARKHKLTKVASSNVMIFILIFVENCLIRLGMAIRKIFGPDSDPYKNRSKKRRIRIPDSSNILKVLFKKLSATYVL